MLQNVGNIDRLVRLLLSAVLVGVGLFAPVGQVAKLLAFFFAATMFITAVLNFCPLYTFFRINTMKKEQ